VACRRRLANSLWDSFYKILVIGFYLIPCVTSVRYSTEASNSILAPACQDGIRLAMQVWCSHNGGRRDGDGETPGPGQRRMSEMW
jgi:hypothetical protein